MEGTEALRGAASRWSLAGDQQLLDLLQEIHQRIITKCNETNKRLEEMSRGLRDASVNLQNVNNKFLALSNTQFVESRVYDDDTDVAPPVADKEPPKVKDLASDLSKLKASLQTLESFHEPLLIARDSGSDTDSDDSDDRLVLKPKDLYADRPLPYIIGSQAWRSKWHAGLVPDDSDSDSSTSKVEELEQYSDSEEEKATTQDFVPVRKVSSSGSSLRSSSPAPASAPAPAPSPAAVAAELARRLGGAPQIPEREPVYQPEIVARKLYKPQEPLATTIFPDEPPPLDESSSDEDIFAELHRTQPKQHRGVDDLFDFNDKPSALEDALFGPPKAQTNQSIEKPPLFSEDSEPEVTGTPKTAVKEQSDDNVKKPIGGISLFGTNKHAESIGAAILKRNRRKSSTSGDESNTEEVKVVKEVKPIKEVQEVKKERDIFDDLFAKSEKLNKKNAKAELVQPKTEVKSKDKKKDIFSDIFDDIDDIFSSDIVNVQVKDTKKNEKSLFSDDDDLFAEIANVKKVEKVIASEKSGLFDDVTPKVQKNKSNEKSDILANDEPNVEHNIKRENKVVKEINETKSLFDSDSDDGLFMNVTKDVKQNISKTEKPVEYKLKDNLFDDDEDDGLFEKDKKKPKLDVTKNISKANDINKKTLLDSDDELFEDAKINVLNQNRIIQNTVAVPSVSEKNDKLSVKPVNEPEKDSEKRNITQPGDNESGMLNTKECNNPSVIDSINNDLFFNEAPPPLYVKEQTPEVSHDSFDDEETNIPTTYKGNSNAEIVSRDSQSNESKDISDDVFSKPSEQTSFNENVLRTTRIASDDEKLPTEPHKRAMFNDSDDDLFRSEPKLPDKSLNQKDVAPKPTTPELFTTPSNKNDIFSDIFDDVPPVFEKPKEPKKSKNVNALFDDDSDDETLFFKKNDVITDEKPDFNPSEERFGIFNDEPPAIDIDFTQKPGKKGEAIQRFPKSDDSPPKLDIADDFLPESVKADSIVGKLIEKNDALNLESEDITDHTSKEPKKIGKLKPMNININVNSLLPGASPKKKQIENIDNKQEQTASNEELHKTVNMEPKMVKSISFDDPEILDNKMSKERAKIQVKRRPSTRRARREAVRKSAIDFTDSSFDSSNDNSTKEEVKEKIVKTVYILNDDDIFGTTKTSDESTAYTKKHLNIVDSDEELLKKPDENVVKSLNLSSNDQQATVKTKSNLKSDDNDDIFKKSSNPTEITNDEVDTAINKVISEERTRNVDILKVTKSKEIKNEMVSNQSDKKSFLDSDNDDFFKQTDKKPPKANVVSEPKLDSNEKSFKNTKTNIQKATDTKSFLDSDDDDDLFKTMNTETKLVLKSNISSDEEDLFKNKGIGTLGKVYNKPETAIKETHNIFDDFPAKLDRGDSNSIPEVTQSKTDAIKQSVKDKTVVDVEKTVKKSILDDLSDEDDLFKSKTKLVNRKDTSLFGDDDGDDLFGTKTVKEVKPEVPVALPTKETKAAETVFVDPLSLFGDDD